VKAKWIVALVALMSIAGCREYGVPPSGSYDEVLLVTEDGATDEFTHLLTPILTREHDYVISKESNFEVFPVRAENMEAFPVNKNIVICGPLDESTEVGQRILDLIGGAGAARVSRGEASILKKDDLPAPGQVTIIVTAPDAAKLEKVIEERGDELTEVLEESCRERLRKHLLERPNPELTKELHRKYGFTIDLSYLYLLHSEATDPPGVELIREPPARVLGIYWVDRKKAPTIDDQDELFEIRSNYVWKRYSHDKMDRDKVSFAAVRFGRYDAIRMSGYWYNDDDVAGGYFETYFIFDDDAKLLWAVDLVVFAPGRPKHPLVRELQALAETFHYDD